MRRAITVVVGLALLLAGCGSADGSDGSSAGRADEGTVPGEEPATAETTGGGAGTELGDGLVVPEGATLAGPIFRRPADPYTATPLPPVTEEVPETITPPELGTTTSTPTTSTKPPPPPDPERETWTALLTIDGDPFAIWDALAAQARDVGLPMGGSAAACQWWGDGHETAVLVAEGEPDDPIERLVCEYVAATPTRLVDVTLRSGRDEPGSLLVEAGPAQRATPEPSAEPVDPAAHDLLPEPAAPEDPAPGDPFGGEGNCFVSGYTRFPLPEGATLVATEGGPDGTSVLAVDEIDLVIDALETAAYAGDDAYSPPEPRELPLSDGRAAVYTEIVIDAGGGACSLLGSPDGRFLLITMHSD